MVTRKRTQGYTTIYKTLHRKLKIEQHESHQKLGVNSGAPSVLAVPSPHVTPVMLLFNNTKSIRYGNRVRHQYS